jgi:hypothetical protein
MGRQWRRMRDLFRAAIAAAAIASGLACSGGSGTAASGSGSGGGSGEGGGSGGSSGGSGMGGGTGMDGGAGGGIGTPTSVPLASFGQAYEDAFCAPLVKCHVFPDIATCEAATPFAETSYILTAVGAAQRGTIHYDPVAAAACVAGLPTTCPFLLDYGSLGSQTLAAYDLMSLVPACAGVFNGQLAQGASCQISAECGTNGYCNAPNANGCGTNQCCPGTCVSSSTPPPPQPALGADCSVDPRCPPPAVCDGTCIIPPAEGASCNPYANYPCGQLDDYCALADMLATTGTCTKRLTVGLACDSTVESGPCYLDEACVGNPMTHILTCAAGGALGGSCGLATDGCLGTLTCTSGGVCAAMTPGMDCGPPP